MSRAQQKLNTKRENEKGVCFMFNSVISVNIEITIRSGVATVTFGVAGRQCDCVF
jgi:hypothetical protein